MKWKVLYKKAYNPDGSLFFPGKISHEFLESAKRTMGSYMFANQYLNEIIPAELQTFKKEWFKYYAQIPDNTNTFIFVDPALSEADGSDFTGVVIVKVDTNGQWYIPFARRYRVTPTALIQLIFDLHKEWNATIIGIEEVAYQKALLYFLDEEMRRRGVLLPVKGVKAPTTNNKQARILSLVPRFEWGHVSLTQGLNDLELELLQFPRGSHDDLIDALAYVEYIYYKPQYKEKLIEQPKSPTDPAYEKWYIQQLTRGKNPRTDSEESY